jgi:antitoxin (DNA-binding transcriptional repressor) of toxin-antitoxin stability system
MKIRRTGAEEARSQLPALLSEAERGRCTIIMRRGQSVAALVPATDVLRRHQKPITPLAGSGKGLWGRSSTATLRRLRSEWSR